jgi:excisionase family DNA binding protein
MTMAKPPSDAFATITPTEAEATLARESSRRLAAHLLAKRPRVRIQIVDNGETPETVAVPAAALRLLLHILTEMAEGNAVTLVPVHAELTTQQAADILNVSRPYVVKLLDEGKIPSRTVGKFRRVRLDDLVTYKKRDDDARAAVADRLAAEAQELGVLRRIGS